MPGEDISVGSVSVEVTASARGFARSLRREVDGAFKGVGKSLQRALNKELGGSGRQAGVQVGVRIDDEQVAREARRALTGVRRVFKDAGPVQMRIQIPEAQAAREARAAARVAAKAAGPIALKPQADGSSSAGAGRKASETATRAAGPIRLKADVDRSSIGRVASILGTVAKAALLATGGLAAIGAIGSGVSAGLAGVAAAAGGLIQILGQLVGVAIAAAGALAALPGAFAILGAGIGTAVIGASGLGAALREAGSAAGGAGGAAVDMGRQIERASRQVVLAERRVADAQRDAKRAQEDLNRAREEARENLEDLALSLARARLDEEAAVFALADAEAELRAIQSSPFATADDIARADLAYREAAQSLAEVREQLGDVTKEQSEAAKKGVKNADVVVDAQERQREAALALEDAQYDLAQAHLDLADAQRQAGASGGGVASAMSKLAPAARELVNTLLALKPAWDALKLDVQQALWVGVAAEVKNLADAQLPVLHEGLVGIAKVLNGAMKDGLRELATQSSQIRLAEILGASARAFDGLAVAIRPVIRALLDLTSVGATVVADLAGPAGEALTRFADRISEMAASGELRQLMLDGFEALKLLGGALLDVGGILKGVFGAAAAAGEGGGIFTFLDNLNRLVNSVAGQEALTTLFAELGRIGTALMPVLLALGRGLGVVAEAIGDIAVGTAPFLAEFLGLLADALASLAPGFIALGPSVVALGRALLPLGTILSDLVVGIAPGVEAFLLALADGLEFLAPVASIVGEALGDLLAAVAPLLPVIGAALANALTELAIIVDAVANGPLMVLIGVFSDLATEWATRLLPILLQLATDLFPIFADAGLRLLEAFEPLVPVFAAVADMIAGKLSDAMPQLVEAFSALALAIADMSVELVEALVDALIQLVPELPALVDAGLALALALADLAVAMVPLIPLIADLLVLVLRMVTPGALLALTALVRTFAGTMKVLATILPIVAFPLRAIVTLFRAVDWGAIGSRIGETFSAAWDTVADFFTALWQWFADLPGTIASAIGNTSATLRTKGRDFVTGLFNGITSRFTGVSSWLRGLGGWARTAVGNLIGTLAGRGRDLLQGLRNGITDRWNSARSFLAGIPGRAQSAVGSLFNTLWAAGRNLIQGLINGITSKFRAVQSTLSTLTSFLPDWKGPLNVDMRILYGSGQAVMAGFEQGVKDSVPSLRATLGGVTNDIATQFAVRHDPLGSVEGIMSFAPAPEPRQAVVIDATGLPRALAEWLRGAVRTQGGGSVQRFAGQGAR